MSSLCKDFYAEFVTVKVFTAVLLKKAIGPAKYLKLAAAVVYADAAEGIHSKLGLRLELILMIPGARHTVFDRACPDAAPVAMCLSKIHIMSRME